MKGRVKERDMQTNNNSLCISSSIQEGASLAEDSVYEEDSDLVAGLWEEYKFIVNTLRKQGSRQEPVLLMRLTVVMIDLGLYQPSPP
jgi:hypothetical protein